ncbi:helix-turn-helix domain-containing protein [Vreelandella sp. F11]|uniref:helix-turn-helix domain-containing protein n=1 Tax=Vreelandella sp. F11 TaxID=3394751 RepID=UPI0036DBB390
MQLLRAISLLTADSDSKPSQNRITGRLARWQIARVNDFIDQHLGRCIRTIELASLLGLSTSYFSHLFKQTMGVTPLMYVTARRVEAAGQYMLSSECSLSEIALRYGFCDQSHLCRVFKRETGLSPQTWRKRYVVAVPYRSQASTPYPVIRL